MNFFEEKYNEKEPKGDFVLVIEGRSQEEIKEEKRKINCVRRVEK